MSWDPFTDEGARPIGQEAEWDPFRDESAAPVPTRGMLGEMLVRAGREAAQLPGVWVEGAGRVLDVLRPDPVRHMVAELDESMARHPVADKVIKAGEGMRRWAADLYDTQRAYRPDPARDDQLSAQLGSGLGSMAGFFAVPGGAAPKTLAAMLQAGVGGVDDLRASPNEGHKTTERQAFTRSAPLGAIEAASEILPGGGIIRRAAQPLEKLISKPGTLNALGRILKETVKQGVVEGAEEVAQNIGQNIIAKDVLGYDPDRERTAGAADAGKVGAILGGLMGGGIQTAAETLSRGTGATEARRPHLPEIAGSTPAAAPTSPAPRSTAPAAPSGQPPARSTRVGDIMAELEAEQRKEEQQRAELEAHLEARRATANERRAFFPKLMATIDETLAGLDQVEIGRVAGLERQAQEFAEDNSLGFTRDQRAALLERAKQLGALRAKLQPAADAAAAERAEREKQRAEREKQRAALEERKRKADLATERAQIKAAAKAGIGASGAFDYEAAPMAELETRAEAGDQQAIDAIVRRTEREAVDQADDRPDLLTVLKRVRLPHPDVATTHRGELETLAQGEANFGTRQAMFSRDKNDLDRTAEVLRVDHGFDQIQTPDDLLQMAQRAMRGERIMPTAAPVEFTTGTGGIDSGGRGADDGGRGYRDPITGTASDIRGNRVSQAEALRIAERSRKAALTGGHGNTGTTPPVGRAQLPRVEFRETPPAGASLAGLRLTRIGQGVEADVYAGPDGATVYKILTRGKTGSAGMSLSIGSHGEVMQDTSTPDNAQLRAWLLTAIGGVPTEVVGMTQDGAPILKQPRGAATTPDQNQRAREQLTRVPDALTGRQGPPVFLTWAGDAPVLVGDLHEGNFTADRFDAARIHDMAAMLWTSADAAKAPQLAAWIEQQRATATRRRPAEFAKNEAGTPAAPPAATAEQAQHFLEEIRREYPEVWRQWNVLAGDLRAILRDAEFRGDVPAMAEAAIYYDPRVLAFAYAAMTSRGKAVRRFLHEMGHQYWRALPAEARTALEKLHEQERAAAYELADGTKSRTKAETRRLLAAAGPLYQADGNLKPQHRLEGVEELTPFGHAEWFAERIAAVNAAAVEGRMLSAGRNPAVRLLHRIAEAVRELFRTIGRALAGKQGADFESDFWQEKFNTFLASGGTLDMRRAGAAYAREKTARFATQGLLEIGGPVGIALPREIANLTPRWQTRPLRFQSNLDKALYYSAGDGNTEVRDRIIAHLVQETGLTSGQVAALARQLRQRIGAMIERVGADGTLVVPPTMPPAVERLTGAQFATPAPGPWPEEVRDAVVMSNVATLRAHEYYSMAKSGGDEHAWFVAIALMDPAKLKALHDRFPDAVLVPVQAAERAGHNALPRALAEAAAHQFGWKIEGKIVQRAGAGHTGTGAAHRLANPAAFDGPVQSGRDYILVDDVLTSGATINALRAFIEAGGGRVVGVTAFGASGNPQTGFGGHLAPRPEVLATLDQKFGRDKLEEFLREAGIAETAHGLTNSQARYLATFATLDAARGAVAARRVREEGAPYAGDRSDDPAGTGDTAPAPDGGIAEGLSDEAIDAYAASRGIPEAQKGEAREAIRAMLAREEGEQYEFDLSPAPSPAAHDGRAGRRLKTPEDRTAQARDRARVLTSAEVHSPQKWEQTWAGAERRVSSLVQDVVSQQIPGFDIRGATIKTPGDFAKLLMAVRSPYFESIKVAFLNERDEVVHSQILTVGTLSSSPITPNRILGALQEAAKHTKARRVIYAHNHPSGDVNPSAGDLQVTNAIEKMSASAGLEVIDHVITDGDRYYSLQREHMELPLDNPEMAPWEAVERMDLPKLNDPGLLVKVVKAMRQGKAAGDLLVLYTSRKNTLLGVERFKASTSRKELLRAIADGTAREGAAAFMVDFPPGQTRADDINMLRELRDHARTIDVDLLDAWNGGRDGPADLTYREKGLLEDAAIYGAAVQEEAATPASAEMDVARQAYETAREQAEEAQDEVDAIDQQLQALKDSQEEDAEQQGRALQARRKGADAMRAARYKAMTAARDRLQLLEDRARLKAAGERTVKQRAAENPREALIAEYEEAGRKIDEAGKAAKWAEVQYLKQLREELRERLDKEFPGWRKERSATDPVPVEVTAGGSPIEPQPGENEAMPPPAREFAQDAAKLAEIDGHTQVPETALARTWKRMRELLAGFRGAVPELPTFGGAFWNRDDEFLRGNPTFYNRLKEGVRELHRSTPAVYKDAEAAVANIIRPLLRDRKGPRFPAADYRRLARMQRDIRTALAEGRKVPEQIRKEVAALNTRLEADPYVLFGRLVLYLDLDWRASHLFDDEGNPIRLPGDLNPAEVKANLERLRAAAEAHPQAEAIARALRAHANLVRQVMTDLQERELLGGEHLRNPWYFPHHILERTPETLERVRIDTAEDFRGYLQDPVGSTKPIETDYVAAMYRHMVAVLAHNRRADIVEAYFREPYDIRDKVRKRAQALARSEGRPVSWREAFFREFADQGYTIFGADAAPVFIPAIGIDRDKLARILGAQLTAEPVVRQLAALGIKGIALRPEDIHEALMAGEKEYWIVPEKVADALRGVMRRAKEKPHLAEKIAAGLQGAWKRNILFAPWNYLRYEFNNTMADLEKMLSADPGMAKKLPRAMREVHAFFAGRDDKVTPEVRQAFRLGVLDTVTANEIGGLLELREFDALATDGRRVLNWFKRHSTVAFSRWREASFRYAKYLADLERIQSGARPYYAGAYWQDIEAIGDSSEGAGDKAPRQAAQISLATFGDYHDITANGEALRRMLVPFYSWTEVNWKYHANLLRNMRDALAGADAAMAAAAKATKNRAAAVAGFTFTRKAAAGFLLRFAVPYLAVLAWNNSGDREEIEDELSEEDKRRFHLVLGRDANGKAMVIYTPTAFSDIFRWFSGPEAARLAVEVFKGDISPGTAFEEWTQRIGPDFINNTVGQVGPLYKVPVMAATRKQFFPDVTEPRTIPAYDLRRSILANMTDQTVADIIERAVNKDYVSPRDFGEWATQTILQVRRRDAEEWAFYGIKDKAAEYLERQTGRKRESDYDAPDQQVLRNFRRAIYRGDLDTALRTYDRLLELGYTAERFTSSVRAQDPLSMLPVALREQFRESLNPHDRDMLERANRYYARMKAFRGDERRLFPRSGATPAQADNNRRRFRPRPDLIIEEINAAGSSVLR